MTKTQAISLMILEALNNGKSHKEAVDSVLGQGTWDRIVSELYDELRSSK